MTSTFQSTLPAWGATSRIRMQLRSTDFNPRSPRGERLTGVLVDSVDLVFQSTLPAWGATYASRTAHIFERFQSTLPAWGATVTLYVKTSAGLISIHAPRVGSDYDYLYERDCGEISIHAPRVGSDGEFRETLYFRIDFNPRSPRGERRDDGRF